MYFSYILDVFLTFFVATTQYTIELVYLYLSMSIYVELCCYCPSCCFSKVSNNFLPQTFGDLLP